MTYEAEPYHLCRIPTESTDVLLHPLQARELILETEIEQAPFRRLGALRPPKRSEAVADANIHDRCVLLNSQHTFTKFGKRTTHTNDAPHDDARRVEDGGLSKNETASVYPHGYWELGILGDSRRPEYVQSEAIFRCGAEHRVLRGVNEPHRELEEL